MKAAGLIFDNSFSYLDHLAPFCALHGWPLILCDPDLQDQARHYYPDLILFEGELFRLGEWIDAQFTHLVSCTPRSLLKAALGNFSFRTLWLPHGHSDKGQIFPFLDVLREEESVLIYGQKMADQLAHFKIPHQIRVGNFRWIYYQKNRHFFQSLPLGYSFAKSQKMVFYAPTWQDSENNCSLWEALPALSQTLPDSINLLVKPHPNTILREAPRLERLIGKTERANLQFLLENPPIFPLLDRCDAYLGDRSSIGYDALFFDKPLFFLDPHKNPKGRELLPCGQCVTPENAFSLISRFDAAAQRTERQAMLSYSFDNRPLLKLH